MTRRPPSTDDAAFDDSMRDLFGAPQPPAGMRGDIVARVRREAAPVRVSDRTPRRRRTISGRRSRPDRNLAPVFATAAALLVTVAAFVLLTRDDRPALHGPTDAPRVRVTVNEERGSTDHNADHNRAVENVGTNDSSDAGDAVDAPANESGNSNRPLPGPGQNGGETVDTPHRPEPPRNEPRQTPQPDSQPGNPPDRVEVDPDTTPAPRDPERIQPEPQTPVAVLHLRSIDGRQPRTARPAEPGQLLHAGETFELTSGLAVFSIAAPTGTTRIVLHGRASLAVAAGATVDAPVVELADGDLFIDAGWSPAGMSLGPLRIDLGDCRVVIDRPTNRGDSAFAGHISRKSQRRAEVHVLAGGVQARIDDVALEDGARVDVDLTADEGQRTRIRSGRAAVSSWLAADALGQQVFAADFDDLPLAPERPGSPWYGSPQIVAVTPDSPDAGRCARIDAGRNTGYQFAQLDAPADMLPWQSGMQLTFRVRVPSAQAAQVYLHMFDATNNDNFAVDFTFPSGRGTIADGEWHSVTLDLDDLRDRKTASQAPGAAQRFVNLNFGHKGGAAVDIDDLRLVRRFR